LQETIGKTTCFIFASIRAEGGISDPDHHNDDDGDCRKLLTESPAFDKCINPVILMVTLLIIIIMMIMIAGNS